VDNLNFQHLQQMVELHQITHWHPVELAEMEILEDRRAALLQVVVVEQVVQVAAQLAELVLTQIFLAQHLCTAVVVLDQAEVPAPHRLAAEPMPPHQSQIEAGVAHSPLQAAD
jgi:hypothetical protein